MQKLESNWFAQGWCVPEPGQKDKFLSKDLFFLIIGRDSKPLKNNSCFSTDFFFRWKLIGIIPRSSLNQPTEDWAWPKLINRISFSWGPCPIHEPKVRPESSLNTIITIVYLSQSLALKAERRVSTSMPALRTRERTELNSYSHPHSAVEDPEIQNMHLLVHGHMGAEL